MLRKSIVSGKAYLYSNGNDPLIECIRSGADL